MPESNLSTRSNSRDRFPEASQLWLKAKDEGWRQGAVRVLAHGGEAVFEAANHVLPTCIRHPSSFRFKQSRQELSRHSFHLTGDVIPTAFGPEKKG